jgi:hypothetical protein
MLSKVENIFLKEHQKSSVFQTETQALLHWIAEITFELFILNLCLLSWKTDLYWEMYVPLHDTSLVYL